MTFARAALNAAAGRPQFPAKPIKHVVRNRVDLTTVTQLAGGSVVEDTTDPIGGQSGHLRATYGTTISYKTVTLPTPWDLTDGYVRVTLRMQAYTNTRSLQIRIADTAASYAAGNFRQYLARPNSTATTGSANWLTSNTWTWDAMSPGTATTTGTGVSNLASIGFIVLGGQSLTGTTYIDFARLENVAYASPKAKCVIWHDDTVLAGAQGIDTRCAAYGFPWTEATGWELINTEATYISTAQAKAYQTTGIQFGTHATTSAEHSAQEADNLTNQAYRNMIGIRRTGLSGGHDMAWWGGQSITSPRVDVIQQFYRSGRFNTSGLQVPEMLPPANPWSYKALLVAAADTFTGSWQPYLQNAIAARGLATFVFHQDIGGANSLTTEFETMLAWLDTNRASIDVVTVEDALTSST